MRRRKPKESRRPFRLVEGDLAVRKFYRAVVLVHTGRVSGTGRRRKLEFRNDAAGPDETLWEYTSQLRQRRLYTVLRLSKSDQIKRRAYAIAKVVALRLGR